ncbi:MAG: peptide deformylase [Actinomycetota bacterium]
MALRKIRVLGDPVLREKSQLVEKIDESIIGLANDLIDSINCGYQPGVGLAAPQIGVSRRVIVLNYEGDIETYINPRIEVLDSGQETEEEGCLSIPNLRAEVKRASKIRFTALKLDGGEVKIEAEGMQARIFQHEVDHLEGLLFIDRVDKKTKRRLIMEYSQQGKEKVD